MVQSYEKYYYASSLMIESNQLKQFDIFDILKTKNHLIKGEIIKAKRSA